MENKMIIRAGARLNFTIYRDEDSDAISATFLAKDSSSNTITDTVVYSDDGEALFQFDAPDTSVVGVYEFQVSDNFATGSPDIYPTANTCEDNCDLPTLEICESLEEEVS